VHCVREPPLGLEIRPAIRRRERQRVQTMIRHLARGAGLAQRDARLLDGAPVDTLIDAVNEEDADILVMGTVVRGPVRQLLIGSTTEQLIHAAPCDLLLVKPDSARIGTRR
jgi:universal stress protein E